MKPKIYVETSVISYVTARPSRDLVVAARQEITRDWWENHSSKFDLFVSELVFEEAGCGDEEAATRRLNLIENIPLLETTEDAAKLARHLIDQTPLPSKAAADAFHIANATVHKMNYLLTWNCRHIANAVFRAPIENICRINGYSCPIICTPDELIGE